MIFRALIGITAAILLTFGATLYGFRPDVRPAATAISIRVGLLLGAIWLAFPQLEKWKHRLPTVLVSTVLVCLVIVAARPKLGQMVAILATITVTVSSVFRWLKKQPPPQR